MDDCDRVLLRDKGAGDEGGGLRGGSRDEVTDDFSATDKSRPSNSDDRNGSIATRPSYKF